MEENKLAYCGFDCSFCPMFEKEQCKGCKSEKCAHICNECYIKNCCITKKINNCGHCSFFPCDYAKNNLSKRSLDNLLTI